MNAGNMNSNPDSEEAPLDPAVERVRRKMMRLMGISVAIMMTGLMAVIGAIFYKISGSGDQPSAISGTTDADVTNGEIDLPSGSTIVKAELSGGQILLTLKTANEEIALWVYDMATNRVTARIAIKP